MAISLQTLRGCKKGSKAAIKALYQESSGWMLGIAMRYVCDRNEAMSVVNMSILKALENLKKFDENKAEKIESWMKTILVHKLIDYQRKQKNDDQIVDFAERPDTGKPTSINEENTRKEALKAMINSLPTQTRLVFNLYAIEGYKHKEIAEMLNISDGTSKWHLSDARQKLQKMLLKMDAYRITPDA